MVKCILYFNNYDEEDIINKFSIKNNDIELIINSYIKKDNVINLDSFLEKKNEILSKSNNVLTIIEKNVHLKNVIIINTAGFSFETIKDILKKILLKKYKNEFIIIIQLNNVIDRILIEEIYNIEEIESLIELMKKLSKPNGEIKLSF